MSRWIKFVETANPGRVTRRWLIRSRSSGGSLGYVSWHVPWRRYSFSPVLYTTWSPDCLRDVATFCEKQTKARKLERMLERAGKVKSQCRRTTTA